MGIFEILVLDEDLRRAILARASTQELRRIALAAGMRPLRAAGIAAIAAGRTSLEEVLRETNL
jgi:type II secretory ATPase GspE/PulE/Tfp pilus assembly ATPase PilB-like protein